MQVKFVDLSRQYASIKPQIDRAIEAVLLRTDFILGKDVNLFEEEFAAYCETDYAVGLDNGASALELGMRALGLGHGDEVLVPANSFIASASAVSLAGAKPVFVDVDPQTYTIDAAQIERHISPATRAIMPVHLYGQPADMDPILDIARRRNLYVIEDACQAHGARYKGRRVGSLGHLAAFSFYPGKNLGAYGDGGAIVTGDNAIADAVRVLRNCGQRTKYLHERLGGNHRLDTLQAAILRVKLRFLDNWNELRKQLAEIYDELLGGAGVVTPAVAPYAKHVYHIYAIQADRRDALQNYLSDSGVSTGIHYPLPIHLQPAYAPLGYKPGDFPVTEQCAERQLSLPMFPELEPGEAAYVVDSIRHFVFPLDASRRSRGEVLSTAAGRNNGRTGDRQEAR